MKKIILTLSGVLFVIVTGYSLLICMMNGIPNLDQPAAAFLPGESNSVIL